MKRPRMVLSAIVIGAVTLGTVITVSGSATAAAKKSWTRTSDFNSDGYQDLAIGAPGGTVAGKAGAGYVAVIPGSKKGLVPAKKRILSQATAGVPGSPAVGKWFGASLASADLNGDGYADLV
ncbi:MAG TPA: FG-GAP-like repeat-containing protein, partial [Actinoplanes sp.]|nr:FG-GAP-like repeat-containing protein [Actinoplanes sp.]